MALQGQAKTDYMRQYMRDRRRQDSVRPPVRPVRPDVRPNGQQSNDTITYDTSDSQALSD